MNLRSQQSASTCYVWGRDLSGSLDGAGGVGGLLATEVGGVWYFPLYDNNGNITDYVSETGEVVASYTYDAFGRTIAQSGSMADVFPFRFSTKYYDAETGLYYYGYRYYSPELGRWLTRDPIGENGGDNLYAFCGNNGVNAFDALGEVPTAQALWEQYQKYSYAAMTPENVWRTVGGTLKDLLWKDETKAPPNACATRLSMSLVQIPGEEIPNGERDYVNTVSPGAKGIPGNYIVRASKMGEYLRKTWGTSSKCSHDTALYFKPSSKAYETKELRAEIMEKVRCCDENMETYVAVVVSVTQSGRVSGHVAVITPAYNDDHTPYTDNSEVWILPPLLTQKDERP